MALTVAEIKRMIMESIPQEMGEPAPLNDDGTEWEAHKVLMNKTNYEVVKPEITRNLDGEIFAGLVVEIVEALPDNKILVTQ